jgi:hypothetical protein
MILSIIKSMIKSVSGVIAGLCVALLSGAAQPARAVISIFILQSGPNVEVSGRGSLNVSDLTFESNTNTITPGAVLQGNFAEISINSGSSLVPVDTYNGFSSAPTDFGPNGPPGIGDQVKGDTFFIFGDPNPQNIQVSLPGGYNSGDIISFSFTILNRTLQGSAPGGIGLQEGNYQWLTATGLDSINVCIGRACIQKVPGPLPALGAAAAFGYSRKLRKRISAAKLR